MSYGTFRHILIGKRGVNSHWHENTLILNPKCREHRGGGIFITNKREFKIYNFLFFFNGYVKDGGGLYLYNCEDIIMENNVFVLNFAKWGGGIYVERSSKILIKNNVFILNFALRDGGAISISNSTDIVLQNNKYYLNIALRRNRDCDIHKSKVSIGRRL